MSTRTDSHTVEHHDDGTWTETVVYHGRPPTKKEQAAGWLALGGVLVIGCAPLGVLVWQDWRDRRRTRKEAAKKTDAL